ncbi:MAG: pilin glycosylation ligase domain-containing protein, partial [Rubrivivax sp.]
MQPPLPSSDRATPGSVMWALLPAATGLPVLFAYNTSPSTTFFNQALAIGLWGAITCWASGRAGRVARCGLGALGAGPGAVLAAFAGIVVGALLPASVWWTAPSLAGGAVGVGAAAAGVVLAAGRLAPGAGRAEVGQAFLVAWVLAGLASAAVAMVQVFAPSWPDGDVIAHSSVAGRAVGNLRQPNHLSSVLLWAAIALIGWLEIRRLSTGLGDGPQADQDGRSLRHWTRVASWLCLALFIWAIVLTASRTGLVGVALLALWGLADRRVSRGNRLLLLATPLLYALAWWGMAWWAQSAEQTF